MPNMKLQWPLLATNLSESVFWNVGMFASDTYHRTCRSPTAVHFHPDHGIPPRWWNCSPLQEPLPLWAAEWCLRNRHTFRRCISDGMCHFPTEQGWWGNLKWGAIQPACREEIWFQTLQACSHIYIMNNQQRWDHRAMNPLNIMWKTLQQARSVQVSLTDWVGF